MIRFSMNKGSEHVEIELIGDLDIDSTEVIEVDLMPEVEAFQFVDLNFKEVPFIDSSGIGLLLNAVQTLKDQGTTVAITNVREEVMDIFELLQIPDILGEGVFR